MNYNGIDKDIERMIADELRSANEQFPPFHSFHEAYGVIKEEVEEASFVMNGIKSGFDWFWENVKCNDEVYAFDELADVKKYAFELIKEAVQICAMCQKAIDSLTPYQAGTGRAGGEEKKKVVYTYRE